MTEKREQIMHTRSIPLGWFLRWAAYGVLCVDYLFGLFVEPRTLMSFLLLTGIFGAWLFIYHTGRRTPLPWWFIALACLACASLVIPVPRTNAYWLPILPTVTACIATTAKPRWIGWGVAGILWVSTSIAIGILTRQWDIGGQIILLISFSSTCGCTATISALTVAHAKLLQYSTQVEELTVISERNRIAREIHDTLGHSLTLLAVQLETATQLELRGDPRLHEELLSARQVVKACLTEVRYSVEALRPEETSTRSLQEQLGRLVAEFESTCPQTTITLDLDEAPSPIHPEVCFALYRCAQEALTNIRKHASATKVLLRLSTTGGNGNQVELTVLDNGKSYPSNQNHQVSGFGLMGMGERAALLGGTLRAGPEPIYGWRVELVLPRKIQKKDGDTPTIFSETRGEVRHGRTYPRNDCR